MTSINNNSVSSPNYSSSDFNYSDFELPGTGKDTSLANGVIQAIEGYISYPNSEKALSTLMLRLEMLSQGGYEKLSQFLSSGDVHKLITQALSQGAALAFFTNGGEDGFKAYLQQFTSASGPFGSEISGVANDLLNQADSYTKSHTASNGDLIFTVTSPDGSKTVYDWTTASKNTEWIVRQLILDTDLDGKQTTVYTDIANKLTSMVKGFHSVVLDDLCKKFKNDPLVLVALILGYLEDSDNQYKEGNTASSMNEAADFSNTFASKLDGYAKGIGNLTADDVVDMQNQYHDLDVLMQLSPGMSGLNDNYQDNVISALGDQTVTITGTNSKTGASQTITVTVNDLLMSTNGTVTGTDANKNPVTITYTKDQAKDAINSMKPDPNPGPSPSPSPSKEPSYQHLVNLLYKKIQDKTANTRETDLYDILTGKPLQYDGSSIDDYKPGDHLGNWTADDLESLNQLNKDNNLTDGPLGDDVISAMKEIKFQYDGTNYNLYDECYEDGDSTTWSHLVTQVNGLNPNNDPVGPSKNPDPSPTPPQPTPAYAPTLETLNGILSSFHDFGASLNSTLTTLGDFAKTVEQFMVAAIKVQTTIVKSALQQSQ